MRVPCAERGNVMKKIIALVLAGMMVFTPVKAFAADSPTSKELQDEIKRLQDELKDATDAAKAAEQAIKDLKEEMKNNKSAGNTYNYDNRVTNYYNYKITIKVTGNTAKTPKVTIGGGSGSKKVTVSEPPFVNTVLKAPGLDNVIPVGQGGKLVIGGTKTRATFVMRESTTGKVNSAKVLAAQVGGSVKYVVETYAPGVRFSKCQVDFKVYGCKNGDVYKVYQLNSKGTWNEVQVDEVREGHVICTVSKAGTFAFIKMN